LRNEGGRGAKASTGKPGGVLRKRCGRPFFSISWKTRAGNGDAKRAEQYLLRKQRRCFEIFREADVEVR
jgi:hypothetical protein